MKNSTDPEVLIVGAGPTGLMLALELCRHGVLPRIIDALPAPSPLSRALVVHARTLELLDRHGLAEAFVSRGRMLEGIALRANGRILATAPVGRLGVNISPYPFLLIISQDQTEAILREALAAYGVQVGWNTRLTQLENSADDLPVITLQSPPQPAELVRAAYVVGCDGARSAVRHALHIDFPGGTYAQTFFVADTVIEDLDAGRPVLSMVQIALASRSFYSFFPMPGGRTRIIGLLPAGMEPPTATFEQLRPQLEAAEQVRVRDVSWFSAYKVHHRVANQFRQGRAFLVGDAGHVHSPAGGQGMNTGLGDAVNLAWKLAAVLRHQAPDALLDTYAAERLPFAQKLVATTDRAFTAATQASALTNWLRNRLAPILVPLTLRLPGVRRLMFRTVSQTGIQYPHSPLSAGRTSLVQSGARLPWFADGRYTALRQPGWQLLAVEKPAAEAAAWARQHGLPLTTFPAGAGETAGTLYLIRPDGYLGLVSLRWDEQLFSSYAARWAVFAQTSAEPVA